MNLNIMNVYRFCLKLQGLTRLFACKRGSFGLPGANQNRVGAAGCCKPENSNQISIKVKFLVLFFSTPFLIHCSNIEKTPPSPDKAAVQIGSEGLVNQARYLSQEILTEGRENADFLLKKLKTASVKYRTLQSRLTLLENRVQQLIRQIQSSEDVEIAVEEDGETALLKDSASLFNSNDAGGGEGTDNLKAEEGGGDMARAGENASMDDKKKEEISSPEKLFIQGQNLFIEQSYEQAIEALEKYRNKRPKGAQYTSATYLIGRAFQELKMPEEAQVFFKELVTGYPKDPFAKKARDFVEQKSAEKK